MSGSFLSVYCLLRDASIDGSLLVQTQFSNGTFRKVPKFNRADGDPDQTPHLNPKRVTHAPDMAVFTFIEHNFHPRVFLAVANDFRRFDLQKIAFRRCHARPQLT